MSYIFFLQVYLSVPCLQQSKTRWKKIVGNCMKVSFRGPFAFIGEASLRLLTKCWQNAKGRKMKPVLCWTKAECRSKNAHGAEFRK